MVLHEVATFYNLQIFLDYDDDTTITTDRYWWTSGT